MQHPLSPKRELPRWIQEHLARERAHGIGELPDGMPVPKERLGSETADRGTRKIAHLHSKMNLSLLKFFALILLIPGLGGLAFSAMVSTDYRENLPHHPSPVEQRTTPRNVHGVMVYQTVEEDKRLSAMEYISVSVFLVGLLLGIFYLEKWSTARQLEIEANLLEGYEF